MKTFVSPSNPELRPAYEYVCHTGKNIFLTGKAGTGKTTLSCGACRKSREEGSKCFFNLKNYLECEFGIVKEVLCLQ